jgi:hypothetical protein
MWKDATGVRYASTILLIEWKFDDFLQPMATKWKLLNDLLIVEFLEQLAPNIENGDLEHI